MYHLQGGDPKKFSFGGGRDDSSKVPLCVQRLMALRCYKVIASGTDLVSDVLDKIILLTLMEQKIPLKTPSKEFKKMYDFHASDVGFTDMLNRYSKANKNSKTAFWPSPVWKSRFMRKFNLKYKKKQCTTYSKTGLLCQLVPSLSMCYAMRKLFDIPGGQGRIINIDESMTYRFVENTKSWTF